MTTSTAAAEPAAIEMPAEGGSYVRDPETGALTRVEWTDHAPGGDGEAAPADAGPDDEQEG